MELLCCTITAPNGRSIGIVTDARIKLATKSGMDARCQATSPYRRDQLAPV